MEPKRQSVWSRLYHSPAGRVLLAALAAAAALAAFSAVQQITYLTNDDNAIAYTLAGYHTGTPAPYALFINCLLGYFVSALYAASPAVPWWAVLQLLCIAYAMTVIGACILRTGAKRGVPLLVSGALFAALLLLLMLQPVVELTYTVTAAILGAAGIALVLAAADNTNAKSRIMLDVLGALTVLGAFLYREETGYAVLCYFFAACAYRAAAALFGAKDKEPMPVPQVKSPQGDRDGLRQRRRALAGVGVLFVVTVACCFGALLFNNAMQTSYHGQPYRTFFAYRERFTDYPRDSYAQNPALYHSVGWDEPLYNLADDWCFLDARINAGTLQAITEGSETSRVALTDAAAQVADTVEGERFLRLIDLFLLCTWTFALFAGLRKPRAFLPVVGISALLLGTAALCLMLALRGRFLARTFPVMAIPCCITAAMIALSGHDASRKDARAALYAYAAIAAVLAMGSGLMQARELRVNSPKELLAQSRAVTQYALLHPENVYYRDTYVVTDVDALTTYPDAKPTNLLSWGGCEMRSETAMRQLAVNRLESPYADALFAQNVYLITRTDSAERWIMEDYLGAAFNGAKLVFVEDIADGIAVYRAVEKGRDGA